MCVEFIDGRFVGYAPVVEAGEEDGEAYIGLSTSADGVNWRPWTRVLKSERDVDLGAKKFRYRSLDQPVCGLLRREGRTTPSLNDSRSFTQAGAVTALTSSPREIGEMKDRLECDWLHGMLL